MTLGPWPGSASSGCSWGLSATSCTACSPKTFRLSASTASSGLLGQRQVEFLPIRKCIGRRNSEQNGISPSAFSSAGWHQIEAPGECLSGWNQLDQVASTSVKNPGRRVETDPNMRNSNSWPSHFDADSDRTIRGSHAPFHADHGGPVMSRGAQVAIRV